MPVFAAVGRRRGLRLAGAAVALGALSAALAAPAPPWPTCRAPPGPHPGPYLTDLTPPPPG
ncbi:hypothetical protein O1L60_05835 [Streptomyces diastatochromogenes]|nr:hypothetical protein [Streptomyces diastatochromogenes]